MSEKEILALFAAVASIALLIAVMAYYGIR